MAEQHNSLPTQVVTRRETSDKESETKPDALSSMVKKMTGMITTLNLLLLQSNTVGWPKPDFSTISRD